MKRDMDLIRQILLAVEAESQGLIDSKYSKEQVAQHVALLQEAGFVNAAIARNHVNHPTAFVIHDLTWSGHEFLDAMRDDTLWNKTKEKFIKPGASWTAKAIFEYLKIEIAQRMGLSGG